MQTLSLIHISSYDYEMKGFKESKLVKLDILLNGEMVDALSMIVHADTAYAKGRRLAERLKENIPRQDVYKRQVLFCAHSHSGPQLG